MILIKYRLHEIYILFKGGKFTHFNYDTDGNVQHYGSPTAPEFDISLTTTPVYLFWGETDGVAPQEVYCIPCTYYLNEAY